MAATAASRDRSSRSAARVAGDPVNQSRRSSEVRVYVKADMEGISGVVSPTQLAPGSPEHENARRLLMHDLNAVLEGAFNAGCTEVVIYDAHGAGLNVDVGELDRRAVVVSGRPQFTDGFFCGLDGSFEALFLVGYHARAGAADALLPRSYDDDIASMCVNTTELGEIGLEAALAGKFGVPLAFVSGDSGAVREAKELLGEELETVEVKQAITSTSAVCLPAAQTHRLLRDAAARAVRKARHMPTVVFQSPTVLEVTFRTRDSADVLERSPTVERTGECSVRTKGSSILAAYRDFIQARSLNGHA